MQLRLRCKQAARVMVTGVIKATATKHKRKAKPKTKTFRVRKRLVRVGAGKHGSSTFKLTISNLRARRRR